MKKVTKEVEEKNQKVTSEEEKKEKTPFDKKSSAEARDTILRILKAANENDKISKKKKNEDFTYEELFANFEDISEEEFTYLCESLLPEDKEIVTEEMNKFLQKVAVTAGKELSRYTVELTRKEKETRKQLKKMYKELPLQSSSASLKTRISHFFSKVLDVLHISFGRHRETYIWTVYKGPLNLVDMTKDEPVYYASSREEALLAVNKRIYFNSIIHYNLWCSYRELKPGFLTPSWKKYYETVVVGRGFDFSDPESPDIDYIYSIMRVTYLTEDVASFLRTFAQTQPLFLPNETDSEVYSYIYNQGFNEYSLNFEVPDSLNTIFSQDEQAQEKIKEALENLKEQYGEVNLDIEFGLSNEEEKKTGKDIVKKATKKSSKEGKEKEDTEEADDDFECDSDSVS